ncbi:MAG: carboxypeptidase M32 [Oscillospiraceae bacterium]|jgi:carboxypeptidase Taq|nr:carboxypeptidase M32 [Oscillospiraceae bacterium]
MTKQEALKLLYEKIQVGNALGLASSIIHWDAATLGVPEKSLADRGAAIGWIGGESFRRFMALDTIEAIETLEAVKSELNNYENAMIYVYGKAYRKAKAVPQEEFEAFQALTAEAQAVWETARKKCDYEMMLPYYEKVFDYQRRLCDWYGYENHPYDALLDDYERGANVEMLDSFFSALREKIVPLLKDIIAKDNQPKEIKGLFDISKQRELMPWLTDFAGYDRTRGKVGEVEHPFCTTITLDDVRITTMYHEDNLMSALFSTIHECGHAIYQQNMNAELVKHGLADGSSMGVHESQSRLYENMICRSKSFTEILLPKLQEKFDYFKDWDVDSLYRSVNIARPSLIRIEADELTYSLHVMVRYELEKKLITGEIKVSDLPKLWADKYEEILGIRPDTLANGVLQDVHWSAGYVGYFPSYAVGTAYGSQLMNTIKKSIDINTAIKNADISPITKWLKENVHSKGQTLSPDELLIQSTGEAFNPKYYVDYLEEKFRDLYLR